MHKLCFACAFLFLLRLCRIVLVLCLHNISSSRFPSSFWNSQRWMKHTMLSIQVFMYLQAANHSLSSEDDGRLQPSGSKVPDSQSHLHQLLKQPVYYWLHFRQPPAPVVATSMQQQKRRRGAGRQTGPLRPGHLTGVVLRQLLVWAADVSQASQFWSCWA